MASSDGRGARTESCSVVDVDTALHRQPGTGALNLYSERVDGFDTDTEDLAINLATHAALALSSARRGQQFRSALVSRDVIGQAKGIIMERYDVDGVHAFRMLSTLSQESNVPVSELAAQLIQREHPSPTNEKP